MLEDAVRFRFVDHRERKADMDEHMVADRRLRCVGEVDLLDDAAEIDARRAQQRLVGVDGNDPTRNR